MATDSLADGSNFAKHALLNHLRDCPTDARLPAHELAAKFGLEQSFVQSVLNQAKFEKEQECSPLRLPRISFKWIGRLWDAIWRGFDSLLKSPSAFIAITSLLFAADCFYTNSLRDGGGLTFSGGTTARISLQDLNVAIGFLVTLLLHMLAYYRLRMARYAFFGGLIVWVISAFGLMISTWFSLKGIDETQRGGVVLLVGFAMFFLSGVYAAFGAFAALCGGWIELRKIDRRQERMSRQELLARYFELQERLEKHTSSVNEAQWESWPIVRHLRSNPYPVVLAAGFLINLAVVFTMRYFNVDILHPSAHPPISFIIISTSLSAVSIAIFGCFAFLGGGPWRAAVITMGFSLGQMVANLLPISSMSEAILHHPSFQLRTVVSFVVFAGVGSLIGFGAQVQTRTLQNLNLQRNDPAAILAEMLKIQWRLRDHSGSVCVMVVDAAQSSVMKLDADPLAVEFSFREYQEWIEEICDQFDGRVHSTAGDGAVVSFPTSAKALAASRRIQTEISNFNVNVNRLSKPFRLRIGLHVGQVAGEINEVQFTDVIDIAAHIQDIAPIRGIAVSDDVAAQLPEEEFVPLARQVDGKQVHIVLNPTES